jgi:hypothetical protein
MAILAKIPISHGNLMLASREAELDRKLLNSPVAIAQRVQIELIKELRKNAPWLIPMAIKF